MGGPGAGHHLQADALIEGREASPLAHRQGEQVGIGDLAGPQQPLPVDQALLEEAIGAAQNAWLGWRQASARRSPTRAAGCGFG